VQLITNHLNVTKFQAAARYRVAISPKAPPPATAAAATGSSKQQPAGATTPAAAIPLDVRQQLLSRLAQQQGWPKDSWQYDPSSNRLFSLQALATGSVVEVQGPAGGKGRSSSSYMVRSITAALNCQIICTIVL
jgi:hypothetical protein